MVSLLTKYYSGEEIEENEWAGHMSCIDQKKISVFKKRAGKRRL
jgi:hypothetical protein